MSRRNGSRSMPTSRSERKQPKNHVTGSRLKVYVQFANHAELQAHFSGRHLEELANTNKKVERMQAKVKKFEERVAELVAKFSKHSERLATGKLPAKWHTPSQIEEDISKERAKLKELQAELCKLELLASEDTGRVGGSVGVDSAAVGGSGGVGGNDKDSDGNWSLGEYTGKEVEDM